MDNTLTYSYDELINKSETIKDYSENFAKEIIEFSTILEKIKGTFSNEEATTIYQNLTKVQEKSEDIQKSLLAFSIAIHDDIAPTYKHIEDSTASAVSDIYGS